MWCLCESSTGYCLGFDVYTGNDKDDPAATITHDLGYRVVMKLMQNYCICTHITTMTLCSHAPASHVDRTWAANGRKIRKTFKK